MRYFLPILLLLACGLTDEPTPTRKSVLTELAKQDITNRLKSPSTAVFVDSTAVLTNLRGGDGNPSNQWTVKMSVDAQNSYGAMIRKRYIVKYVQEGHDSVSVDSYNLKDLW